MSVSPPSAAMASEATPFGRPVRRRIAVPAMLVVGVALALAVLVLHDRVVYYRVDSGSMEPTLSIGARVAIEPLLTPKVGEIVVFHAPSGALPASPVCGAPGQGAGFTQPCGMATTASSHAVFIKRVVAGPGSDVAIRAGQAVVNGVTSPQPFAARCGGPDCNFPTPVRVPSGQYFVLGDNRGGSDDSRFWGPIALSSIIGVVVRCAPLQTACEPWR